MAPAVKRMPLVKTTTSWNGKPIACPQRQARKSRRRGSKITVGGETGGHEHPASSFAVVLDRTLEATLKDSQKKSLSPGEALVEVVDTLHNGRNVDKPPVKLIAFHARAVEKALTFKPAQGIRSRMRKANFGLLGD
ncbi:MAG: hypothetical protein A3F74_20870 [Betaproteobacteria bacterium RIFCSPLOWO2_12_FULL_62_58]|nr:MAG: hypothetical protein A3F74_20870 [Betaproteobacteria bacterium RIFCSPLOWO2_12_FULL_62_58]